MPIVTPDMPVEGSGGLTKLEHFAGLAMQACRTRKSEYKDWEDLAADAVEIAKALLEELEKEQSK